MKLSINKLIANDIINYGMDQTESFNYCVYMDQYTNDFEEKDKKYILDNIQEIFDDIKDNENVSYVELEEDENGNKYFDMDFYWGKLLNSTEMIVLKNADDMKVELELEDVRNITDELLDSNEFNDKVMKLIHSYDNGKELS